MSLEFVFRKLDGGVLPNVRYTLNWFSWQMSFSLQEIRTPISGKSQFHSIVKLRSVHKQTGFKKVRVPTMQCFDFIKRFLRRKSWHESHDRGGIWRRSEDLEEVHLAAMNNSAIVSADRLEEAIDVPN